MLCAGMPVVLADAIAYHDQINTGHLAGILLLSAQPECGKLLPICSGCSLLCFCFAMLMRVATS